MNVAHRRSDLSSCIFLVQNSCTSAWRVALPRALSAAKQASRSGSVQCVAAVSGRAAAPLQKGKYLMVRPLLLACNRMAMVWLNAAVAAATSTALSRSTSTQPAACAVQICN